VGHPWALSEEIRAVQARARAELSEDEGEAVSVYLTFALAKIINKNSVNTFWHYGHNKNTHTFSRHDFAFRSAFCEMNGADNLFDWGTRQILASYSAITRLVHGKDLTIKSTAANEELDTEEEPMSHENGDSEEQNTSTLELDGDADTEIPLRPQCRPQHGAAPLPTP
jgi:putative DNA methylase